MSWKHITSKDFADAVRSRSLWSLTVVFVLVSIVSASVPYLVDETGPQPKFTEGVEALYVGSGLLIPFIGLVIGYSAIVRERETGSIRILLGLPNSRLDVLIGKTLSRCGILAIVATSGFVASLGVLVALYDGLAVLELLAVSGVVLLIGVVCVVVAVTISASFDSNIKVVGGLFTAYLVLFVLWRNIPDGIHWLLEGSLPDGPTLPAWYVLIELLNPGRALEEVFLTSQYVFENPEYISLEPAGYRIVGDVPFYIGRLPAALLYLAWIGIPLAISYHRFRKESIN